MPPVEPNSIGPGPVELGSVELTAGDWLEANRANWDERVPVHVASEFYDRAVLREGGSQLDPIAAAGIARLFPDGLDGVRVLHLQCHFGSDSLSLVHLGAEVVGLDFSRPAVEEARRIAAELGVADRARFIEANVYDARHMLPEPEAFDLVFTTWGTIGWLPDIGEWARIAAWYLKPGGRLYFADGHPAAYMLDGDDGPDGLPSLRYAYAGDEPDIVDSVEDYADDTVETLEHTRTWEWTHPLSETMGAMKAAGLSIDEFAEHYQVPWRIFPATVTQNDGMYGWPGTRWAPLSVELVASNPAH